MEKQTVRVHFNSNQEAINLFYMIEMRYILNRLLFQSQITL